LKLELSVEIVLLFSFF